MMRRNDLLAYIIAGAAIFAFVVLLIFALFRLTDTKARMHESETASMLWATSQAHLAVILLDADIARRAGVPKSQTDVEKRYNVALSRLTLLSEGPQRRYMSDLGFSDELVKGNQAIRAIEADILGLTFGDIEKAALIHETLEPLIQDLGLARNQTLTRQRDAGGAWLDEQRAAIIQVITSILAIIALGVFLSATMLRAMTQRQRFMRSLIRQQEIAEAYRNFVALASHQFRTPLAVIDSSMQRLLRSGGQMKMAEIEKRAGQVRAEVRGLNELIGATLDAVRLDAGQVKADPIFCDIKMLVDQVRGRQLEATPGRTITVHIASAVPPTFETDPLLVDQILGNLVSNAVKYSPPTESVSIRVTAENKQICFAVEDRGVGIPEGEQEKLFGRFFRASTAQGVPGTGVGLSIASQLASLLGGKLEFVSQAGMGSTFILKLPHEWVARCADIGTAELPSCRCSQPPV